MEFQFKSIFEIEPKIASHHLQIHWHGDNMIFFDDLSLFQNRNLRQISFVN